MTRVVLAFLFLSPFLGIFSQCLQFPNPFDAVQSYEVNGENLETFSKVVLSSGDSFSFLDASEQCIGSLSNSSVLHGPQLFHQFGTGTKLSLDHGFHPNAFHHIVHHLRLLLTSESKETHYLTVAILIGSHKLPVAKLSYRSTTSSSFLEIVDDEGCTSQNDHYYNCSDDVYSSIIYEFFSSSVDLQACSVSSNSSEEITMTGTATEYLMWDFYFSLFKPSGSSVDDDELLIWNKLIVEVSDHLFSTDTGSTETGVWLLVQSQSEVRNCPDQFCSECLDNPDYCEKCSTNTHFVSAFPWSTDESIGQCQCRTGPYDFSEQNYTLSFSDSKSIKEMTTETCESSEEFIGEDETCFLFFRILSEKLELEENSKSSKDSTSLLTFESFTLSFSPDFQEAKDYLDQEFPSHLISSTMIQECLSATEVRIDLVDQSMGPDYYPIHSLSLLTSTELDASSYNSNFEVTVTPSSSQVASLCQTFESVFDSVINRRCLYKISFIYQSLFELGTNSFLRSVNFNSNDLTDQTSALYQSSIESLCSDCGVQVSENALAFICSDQDCFYPITDSGQLKSTNIYVQITPIFSSLKFKSNTDVKSVSAVKVKNGAEVDLSSVWTSSMIQSPGGSGKQIKIPLSNLNGETSFNITGKFNRLLDFGDSIDFYVSFTLNVKKIVFDAKLIAIIVVCVLICATIIGVSIMAVVCFICLRKRKERLDDDYSSKPKKKKSSRAGSEYEMSDRMAKKPKKKKSASLRKPLNG